MSDARPLSEEQPLTAYDYTRKLLVCMCYIGVSTLLIRFNKFMMQEDHFPHPMALSTIHTLITSICCGTIYLAAPSLMPAMESTKGSRVSLMKWFIPIAVFFAVAIFTSNAAYKYCSVTFLQFMKEANVIIVFLIACLVGLQTCTRVKIFVILWIIGGASISVSGEIHFAWLGFAFQAVSQFCECTRNVMGEFLLKGRKFDALTFNMFLAPICCCMLLVATLSSSDNSLVTAMQAWWHLLLLSGLVAFSLNFLVATVIKETSAVGFVLCGLAKDIIIVLISAVLFHENVTIEQAGGFLMTLLGIFFWSLLKSHPSSWPVRTLEKGLCLPQDSSDNKALLDGGAHQKYDGEKAV